jgi:hypothetical protein
MKRFSVMFIVVVLAFLRCEMPEDEPLIDYEARKKRLHCIPIRQYATLETDTTGEQKLAHYSVIQDTLTKEYSEEHIRSFTPKKQVFILGHVELSDFSKAGRGIYYHDPGSSPKLFLYEGARIVKRLTKGDSPWTIAEDLGNPSLVDKIEWGRLLPGNDFVIDVDVLSAIPYWGHTFNLPGSHYSIIGTERRRVVIQGADDTEEGQQAGERFLRQEAVLRQVEPDRWEIALYNVFAETIEKKERQHHLRSIRPDNQVYVLGYERLLPELKAMGAGLYYNDPDTGPRLLDYYDAKIVKRIVKGDSPWKIAKALGNLDIVNALGTGVIHPGDTLMVDVDILEATGWTRQAFDLPSEDYRIIGTTVSTVILKTSD